jgi:hypothetical protein
MVWPESVRLKSKEVSGFQYRLIPTDFSMDNKESFNSLN